MRESASCLIHLDFINTGALTEQLDRLIGPGVGMTSPPHHPSVNLETPSRMIDRLREGAAVIYLEGIYDPRKPVPTPAWTTDSPPLGGGITTSRVNSGPRVTVSTIVLVDPLMLTRVIALKPWLEFCVEDKPGSYKLVHPDTEEGQGGQWMPLVRNPQYGLPGIQDPMPPPFQAIWHVVLNVGPMEPKTVEYLNGDRFDLRTVNLRVVDAQVARADA